MILAQMGAFVKSEKKVFLPFANKKTVSVRGHGLFERFRVG